MINVAVFDSDACQYLALTLAHFLWQGTVIGLITAVVASLLRSSSSGRYFVHLTAMLLMAGCMPVTLMVMAAGSSPASHQPLASIAGDERNAHDAAPESLRSVETGSPLFPTHHHALESPATPNTPQPHSSLSASGLDETVSASPPPTPWQKASPYVVGAYLFGLTLMLLRVGVSLYGGHRLRRESIPVEDDVVLDAIGRVAKRLGLCRVPLVAVCQRVSGPVVIGLLQPVVLLPLTLTSGITPQQLEALLTHELAHLRRYDHLALMLQRLIEAVLFFHPAVWYVSRCLSVERENCCDDAVVASGSPRVAYAELLLKLAEREFVGRTASTALAAGDKPSRLRQRVSRLLNPPAEPIVRLGRAGTLAMLCLLAAMALPPALSYVFAQPNATDVRQEPLADQISDVEASDPVPRRDPFVIQILDSHGKGIAGATIEVLGMETADAKVEAPQDAALTTLHADSDGIVQLPRVEGQTKLRTLIKAEGYITHGERVGRDELLVFPDRVLPPVIQMKRPATISGVVTGLDGQPLANAPLSISTDAARPYNAAVANHLKTTTGPDGSFRFEGVVPGVAVLHYPWSAPSARDLAAAVKDRSWMRAISIREAGHIDDVRIELAESTAIVEVNVTEHDGAPLENAMVHAGVVYRAPTERLQLFSRQSFYGPNTRAKTDERGRCRLVGLPPGPTMISASIDGRTTEGLITLQERRARRLQLSFPGSTFDFKTGKVRPQQASHSERDQAAQAEDRALAQRERLLKLRTVMQQRLARLTSLREVERIAAEFIRRHSSADDLGVIHAEVASWFDKHDHAERGVGWIQAGLSFPLSVDDRLRMYQYWSKATRAKFAGQKSAEAKLHTFVPPLLGLLEVKRQVALGDNGFAREQQRRLAGYRDLFADNTAMALTADPQWTKAIATFFRELPDLVPQDADRQPLQRESWVPSDCSSYDSVLIELPKLFDRLVNGLDDFELRQVIGDVLDNLRDDPNGPRVDARRDVIPHLGNRFTVVTDFTHDRTTNRLLLALELKGEEVFAGSFAKALSGDETLHEIQHKEHRVWQSREAGDVELAICVAHGYLLITHDMDLLDKVLSLDPDRVSAARARIANPDNGTNAWIKDPLKNQLAQPMPDLGQASAEIRSNTKSLRFLLVPNEARDGLQLVAAAEDQRIPEGGMLVRCERIRSGDDGIVFVNAIVETSDHMTTASEATFVESEAALRFTGEIKVTFKTESGKRDFREAFERSGVINPGRDANNADPAFRDAVQLDPTFTTGSGDGLGQQRAIEAWKEILERDGLTREQQVFAWWRIGSLAAYNFDPKRGEAADLALAETAFVKVFSVADELISNETLNTATVYGTLPGKPIDRARRLAKAYRWLFTRTDAMVNESAQLVNHNGYGIDGQLMRGGMRLDSVAKKHNFLRSSLADARGLLNKRITEEIRDSQEPSAIQTLLDGIADIADVDQTKR